jgi:phosphatidylserine synthase
MNGVCGSLSVFSSARYLLTGDEDYLWQALALPLAGLFFDFMDGKIARWRKESSMLGQELDSLADLVSFLFSRASIQLCGSKITDAPLYLIIAYVLHRSPLASLRHY